MNVWHSVTEWLGATHPGPGNSNSIRAFLIGALVAIFPFTWRFTRIVATYFHESGHALSTVLTGNRVRKIRLEADTSGATYWTGNAGRIKQSIIAFCGYPAPAITGWFTMWCVRTGHQNWTIAVAMGIATFFALVQRSIRGWALTLLVIGASIAYIRVPHTDQIVESVAIFLCGLAGFLLLASPRTIIELNRIRRRTPKGSRHSDSDALSRLTKLPAVFWEFIFLVFCGVLIWFSLFTLLI